MNTSDSSLGPTDARLDNGPATQRASTGTRGIAYPAPPFSRPKPSPRNPSESRAGGWRLERTFTLRTYLIATALAVLLPMFGLGAIATNQVVKAYQKSYQERLRATARLLSSTLDTEIEIRKAAIMALADSPLLDADDTAALYNYAKQIGDGLGTWVTINKAGGPTLNTRIPYGSPLPASHWKWDAATAGQYHVTNLLHPADRDMPFVALIGPILRDGRVVATIGIPFAPMQLTSRLREGLFTSDGVLCLLDGDGNVVARTKAFKASVGNPSPDWVRAIIGQPGQPVAMGTMHDSGDMIVSIAHPSEAPNWTVVVGEPIHTYNREWVRPLLVLGGGAFGLLVMLLLVVDRFSVWLVRPLAALTQSAKLVARGVARPPETPQASHVAEFEALRVSLNEAGQVMDGRAEAIDAAFASARRERNLLHSVVNGKSDPTIVKETNGRLVLANTAALALLGLPAASVIGQADHEPGLPAGASEARAEDLQVISSGQSLTIERTIEIDGQRRTFLGNKSPWRSTSGEVLGVVVIIHDITEWKQSEARLRDIQAELIRTGRLSAMGAMANGLAHELNQPLAAITNFLGAARRLIARATPAAEAAPPAPSGALDVARGAIEDACKQALRAGEIVSRLRDFIGRGPASMRMEDIGQLIAEACALAMPQETRSRVTLTVTVDPDLEPVFVDRLQIQQVLVNLVINALQAMTDQPRRQLTIAAGRGPAGDTIITLTDTGPGIPQPDLEGIFEPFVTNRQNGLGMGLAIARMIMAAHGGTLAAANSLRGGAVLTLMLPAVLSMEGADA